MNCFSKHLKAICFNDNVSVAEKGSMTVVCDNKEAVRMSETREKPINISETTVIEVFCTLVNWKLKSEAIEAIGLFDRKTTTVQ